MSWLWEWGWKRAVSARRAHLKNRTMRALERQQGRLSRHLNAAPAAESILVFIPVPGGQPGYKSGHHLVPIDVSGWTTRAKSLAHETATCLNQPDVTSTMRAWAESPDEPLRRCPHRYIKEWAEVWHRLAHLEAGIKSLRKHIE